jgi:hypothetical protein
MAQGALLAAEKIAAMILASPSKWNGDLTIFVGPHVAVRCQR